MLRKKIKSPDLINFWSYLAHLTGSAIPLVQSLEMIGRFTKNMFFRDIIHYLITSLNQGHSLSEALKKYPHIFSINTCHLLLLAEQTGNYTAIFQRLEQQEKWKYALGQLIRHALRYPLILLFLMGIFMVVLLKWLIPQIKDYLTLLQQNQLPLITKTFLFISNHLADIGLILSGFILFLFLLSWKRRHFNQKPLRYFIPGLGNLLYQLQILNFGYHFGLLLKAKIDVLGALFYAAEGLSCPWIKTRLKEQESLLIQGHTLSQILPPLLGEDMILSKIIIMGEQSGNLDDLLLQTTEFERQQIQQKLKNLLEMGQPMMVIFMGILLGWTMLAILLPLYDTIGASYG